MAVSMHASSAGLAIAPAEVARVRGAVESRVSVDVTSAPADETARRLTSAVTKELERDLRFRLVEPGGRGAINISLPVRVGWERRLEWTEISYQARLNSLSGRSRVVTGKCWNWNLAVCAKQIADAVAKFATG